MRLVFLFTLYGLLFTFQPVLFMSLAFYFVSCFAHVHVPLSTILIVVLANRAMFMCMLTQGICHILEPLQKSKPFAILSTSTYLRVRSFQ